MLYSAQHILGLIYFEDRQNPAGRDQRVILVVVKIISKSG